MHSLPQISLSLTKAHFDIAPNRSATANRVNAVNHFSHRSRFRKKKASLWCRIDLLNLSSLPTNMYHRSSKSQYQKSGGAE